MIRYADPEVCPCCRMQIPYAAAQCTHCGAVLTGPLAQGLFRTLTHADALVAQLTVPAPVAVGAGAPVSGPAGVPATSRPTSRGGPDVPELPRGGPRRPASRPERRVGAPDPARPRCHLPAGRRGRVPRRGLVGPRHGRPDRDPAHPHGRRRGGDRVDGPARAARRRGGVRAGVPRLPDPGRVRRPGRRLVRRPR